ncbi:MAG: CDP-diacylglycerol--serine O-phosphatidyltransferase [Dongiaceae bacterium]
MMIKPKLPQWRKMRQDPEETMDGRGLSLNRIIPNIVTIFALCAGFSAIRFAMEGKWHEAVIAIVVACIFDALDGRIARLMGGGTPFGAQLDSLSDVVAFGVVPSLMIYFWSTDALGRIGWAATLIFVVCCAVRLARFTAQTYDPDMPSYAYNYFSGVPTPAGAGLALLPLILSFEVGDEILRNPYLNAAWLVVISVLMISKIPTFAVKKVKIRQGYLRFILVAAGVLATLLVTEPWFTLTAIGLAYLAAIPFSYQSFNRLAKETPVEEMEA